MTRIRCRYFVGAYDPDPDPAEYASGEWAGWNVYRRAVADSDADDSADLVSAFATKAAAQQFIRDQPDRYFAAYERGAA